MLYSQLADVFENLSKTTSRLKKTHILATFLQKLDVADATPVLYLLQGRVFAEGDERHIGLATKLVLKALSTASGYSVADIEKKVAEHGDVGDVVADLVGTKTQQTLFSTKLDVEDVFSTLQKIASIEGQSAQEQKFSLLNKLLTSASGIEAKYIVRTVLEDLRVGIAEGTLRDALLYAFIADSWTYNETKNKLEYEGPVDENKTLLKRALDLTNDFATVTMQLIEGHDLHDVHLQIGKPCRAMLARKEKSFDEAFNRTGLPVQLEYKYDGFRLQIHKKGEEVTLFTRSLENVTTQFPDIVAAVRDHVKATNCILDAEGVGYDAITKQYKPFQHISQRIKRKYDIEELAKTLPIETHVFDILKLEDEDVLERSLQDRSKLLLDVVTPQEHKLRLAHRVIVNEHEDALRFYQESLDAGNEGIMIKDVKSAYEPGGRVSAWIKMKPTMEELDLVVVGAEWGTGKRSAWMTSFTLAVRDEDGEFLTVGKVGTGLKELDSEGLSFRRVTELLEPLIITRTGQEVTVAPKVVLEIAYEEIQKSPSYESGYALRFPRVIRLREDKDIEEIANVDDIIELFENQ